MNFEDRCYVDDLLESSNERLIKKSNERLIKKMEISIKHHLQCQALLATRLAQDKLLSRSNLVFRGDDPKDVTYQLRNIDIIPDGMCVGEYIYGRMERDLPIFTGTGS